MVPVLDSTTIEGANIQSRISKDRLDALIARTQNGGAEVVALLKTGSAYYAPAASTFAMVDAILNNTKQVMPCSVLLEGEYGLSDVCIGVPVCLGAKGVEKIINLPLSKADSGALSASAKIYKETAAEIRTSPGA